MKEKIYSKLNEEQNLRKVAELFYIFLITPIAAEKKKKNTKMMQTSSSDNCLHVGIILRF